MEELAKDVARLGGVKEYVDFVFPSLDVVKERSAGLAERVAWEASTAEEDLRGGGEDLADYLPAVERYSKRAAGKLEEFLSVTERVALERTRKIEALKEVKRLAEEVIVARREERLVSLSKAIGDILTLFELAVGELNGEKCLSLFNALQQSTAEARSAQDPRLDLLVEHVCARSVLRTREAFEQNLQSRLDAVGFPLKKPPQKSFPGLDEIQRLLMFLDAWEQATKDVPMLDDDNQPEDRSNLFRDPLGSSYVYSALLRNALLRYRYHFSSVSSTTNDAERPEWAADFIIARLNESVPFLKLVKPGSEVVYANALINEFVAKVIADAHRVQRNEVLQHTVAVAVALEIRLRTLQCEGIQSVLARLVRDEWFFTSWAQAEMSRGETKVVAGLAEKLEQKWRTDEAESVLEAVRNAEETCQLLEQRDMKIQMLRLTTMPLLASLRSTMIDAVREMDDSNSDIADMTNENLRLCCRVCAFSMSVAEGLRERQESCVFYMLLEDDAGSGYMNGGENSDASHPFNNDIRRFEKEATNLLSTIVRCVADRFRNDTITYRNYVRYAELRAPDPSEILAHDLSGELILAMELLESRLAIIHEAMGTSIVGTKVWRALAAEIDRQFFEDIVLFAFVGGDQGSIEVANSSNDYLSTGVRSRTLRQVCYDASVLVSTFQTFTTKPARYFKRLSEAITLIILSLSDIQEWEKDPGRRNVLMALEQLPTHAEKVTIDQCKELLQCHLHVNTLTPREAKEMLIISGLLLPPLT